MKQEDHTYQPQVIFILGIMPRSGTHFLSHLICHHEACVQSVIPEDGLLSQAGLLNKYTDRKYKIWQATNDLPPLDVRKLLKENIGKGLIQFLFNSTREITNTELLENHKIKYLVTKTPQVENIDQFFKYFPNEKLLILIRDGRALVESITKSFDHDFEEATRDWAEAAQKIIAFQKATEKDKFLVINYENIHLHTQKNMEEILDFLQLEKSKYDFNSVNNIPIFGSSTVKTKGQEVHWNPVQKTKDFDPINRASHWTRKQHERFNWLAEKELIHFGYTPKKYNSKKIFWNSWNHIKDLQFQLRQFKKNLYFKLLLIFNKKM